MHTRKKSVSLKAVWLDERVYRDVCSLGLLRGCSQGRIFELCIERGAREYIKDYVGVDYTKYRQLELFSKGGGSSGKG